MLFEVGLGRDDWFLTFDWAFDAKFSSYWLLRRYQATLVATKPLIAAEVNDWLRSSPLSSCSPLIGPHHRGVSSSPNLIGSIPFNPWMS